MTKVVQCDSCGATMKPGADPRIFICDFCKSEKQVAIGEDQLALGLALDLSDVNQFMHDLSVALRHAFPDKTRVHHAESSGGGEELMLIELNLDPHMYVARRERTGDFVAQYKKLVRGVALKTKTMTLDVWVKDLTKSMADHANQNTRVALILAKLRGREES
jgi:hypothetical protein